MGKRKWKSEKWNERWGGWGRGVGDKELSGARVWDPRRNVHGVRVANRGECPKGQTTKTKNEHTRVEDWTLRGGVCFSAFAFSLLLFRFCFFVFAFSFLLFRFCFFAFTFSPLLFRFCFFTFAFSLLIYRLCFFAFAFSLLFFRFCFFAFDFSLLFFFRFCFFRF